MTVGLYYDKRFLDHDTGQGHPERPDRLRAVVKHLNEQGVWDKLEHPEFASADRKTIELVILIRSHCRESGARISRPRGATR